MIVVLSTLLFPYYGIEKNSKIPEIAKISLLEHHIRDNLKLTKDNTRDITNICKGVNSMLEAQKKSPEGISPQDLGLWVNESNNIWPYSLVIFGQLSLAESHQQFYSLAKSLMDDHQLSFFYETQWAVNVRSPLLILRAKTSCQSLI